MTTVLFRAKGPDAAEVMAVEYGFHMRNMYIYRRMFPGSFIVNTPIMTPRIGALYPLSKVMEWRKH